MIYWTLILTCNDGARLLPSYLYYTGTAILALYWYIHTIYYTILVDPSPHTMYCYTGSILVHTPISSHLSIPWCSLHLYYAQECSAKEFTAPPIAHSYTTWLGGSVGKPGAWPMGNANQYLGVKVVRWVAEVRSKAHTQNVEYQVIVK